VNVLSFFKLVESIKKPVFAVLTSTDLRTSPAYLILCSSTLPAYKIMLF
jgi:hypothetical protein